MNTLGLCVSHNLEPSERRVGRPANAYSTRPFCMPSATVIVLFQFLAVLRYTDVYFERGAESRKEVEPGYNDIGLCETSHITSDILW